MTAEEFCKYKKISIQVIREGGDEMTFIEDCHNVMKDYAKEKCQELLEIVAEDLGNGSWYVNEYRILENFDLDEFIV